MKKISLILLILLSVFLISSCNIYNYIPIDNKKPNNHYYTSQLLHDVNTGNITRVRILQMNFYSNREMSKEDINTIKAFISGLRLNNFINKPKDINQRPLYKVFINFKSDCFVINVYNGTLISIQPYDGSYEMDYVDMSNIFPSYNIYNLCKYYFS